MTDPGEAPQSDEGGAVRISGTAQDLTEARLAQKGLAQNIAILRALQEASEEGILVVDENRHVISANRRFVEIWEIPAELMVTADDSQLLAHVITKIVSPEDFLAKVEKLYQQPLVPSHDEIAMIDGRVLERYSSPGITAQGENFGLIWFFRDITERKRMEAALQAQNEQLQELDRLKVTFVNAVSHELRTPITSILGYADFLEEVLDLPPEAPAMEFVSEVRKGARRLRGLVSDLMDFTLIEAGAFKLIRAPGDFGAKVLDVAASLRPQVEKAKLSLEVVLPETPLVMLMDGDRIGQVLSNLIVNAAKFTQPGGTIRVCVSVDQDQVYCEVKDSGVGIADADLPKLFQRYMMLEGGLRRGGTGLGLNICKALVEAHGGVIGVSSVLGEGSIFWFTLPTSAPEAPKQPSS